MCCADALHISSGVWPARSVPRYPFLTLGDKSCFTLLQTDISIPGYPDRCLREPVSLEWREESTASSVEGKESCGERCGRVVGGQVFFLYLGSRKT